MTIYDLTLGGIALPTMNEDFAMEIGTDYTLVGTAVMPSAPRPPAFYSMTIPIYGDATEADPQTTGITLRNQVVALIQNDAARFQGYAFTFVGDPDLNGYLVIGTAQMAYGTGGPSMGEFVLTIQSAALVPAQQNLLALRVLTADRRLSTTPLDPEWRVYRNVTAPKAAVARHYLPVGAEEVLGQTSPILAATEMYPTIYGDAPYTEDRQHGELLTYVLPFEYAGMGDVRIFDQVSDAEPNWSRLGDLDPERGYGWRRVYGPKTVLHKGQMPVLDNGRVRVRIEDSKILIDSVDGDSYEREATTVALGYPRIGSAQVTELTAERAVVQATLRGKNDLATLYVALQRGWPGPTIDIYHKAGAHHKPKIAGGDAHVETNGEWTHIHVGVEEAEALMATRGTRLFGMR